jgi:hydrogenase maturation protease
MDMERPRILIAGIGNIFLGDDAFGVEVVRRLGVRPLAEGVRALDFGIRGLDLAFALTDGWDLAVFVDAVPRGGPPGTLYVIEPDVKELEGPETLVEAHALDPVRVLRLARSLGAELPPVRVVGCEPATLGTAEAPALGLSEPVAAAVGEAVLLIEGLVADALAGGVGARTDRTLEGGEASSWGAP